MKLEPKAKFVEMAAQYFSLLTERVEMDGSEELIALLKSARNRAKKADAIDVTPVKKVLSA